MRWLVLALLACPAVALANGRAPATNGVHLRPGDDHAMYVAATFGLLISHDDGCTFRWVCEDNLGYRGTFDPKYRIAADGTIYATTYFGLRVSRDGGCTFTTATAELPAGDPGRIADVWIEAIDVGPAGEVWVATADGTRPNDVYRSTDGGRTFTGRGMYSATIWWKSLAIAPSRPQRVYATGYDMVGAKGADAAPMPSGHFFVTDDGGDHWVPSPLTDVAFGTPPLPYAVGVMPTKPDVVLMVSSGANPPLGDRLYRSTDGGMTWTEVLATTAAILDVSISQGGVVLVAAKGAAYRSTDEGATFTTPSSAPQLACVTQHPDGTAVGCAANWQPDYAAVARSTDGLRWDKVFRFVELAGPLECPAGTPQRELCAGQWPTLQQQFATTGPTCNALPDDTPVTPPRGGCCDARGREPVGALALAGVCLAWLRRRRQPASSSASASRQLG